MCDHGSASFSRANSALPSRTDQTAPRARLLGMSSLLDRSQASISGTLSQPVPSPSQSDSPSAELREDSASAELPTVFRIAVWFGIMGFVVQITFTSAVAIDIDAQITMAVVTHRDIELPRPRTPSRPRPAARRPRR